jgi:hypothetical protein
VLEDHYGANLVGMVVPKGQTERLAYISEFIEQGRASGLVQQANERAALPGQPRGTDKNKLKRYSSLAPGGPLAVFESDAMLSQMTAPGHQRPMRSRPHHVSCPLSPESGQVG